MGTLNLNSKRRAPDSTRAIYLRRPPSKGSRKVDEAWRVWQAQLREQRRQASISWQIHNRMAGRLRSSLRRKGGDCTFLILDYTKQQLIAHLERQFLPGMGWHNMRLWHIDHIIPLALFKCQSADDPEFKAAWALSNLRPLWAGENLKKGAKRVLLL
jgi:hypothetical protein